MSCFDKRKVNKVAKDTNFVKRNRKLKAFDFLIVMTFGAVSIKHPSLAALVSLIKSKVTREALHKRLTKHAVEFLKHILLHVQQHCLKQEVEVKVLKRFLRVLIHDSSWWGVNKKLRSTFKGFCKTTSAALCKLQMSYEYKSGEIILSEVRKATENDSTYSRKLVKNVQKDDLHMMDLGYYSADFVNEIHEKRAFFLSRFRSDVSIFDPKTQQRIDLPKLLDKVKSERFEINIVLGAYKRLITPCRLICIRAPKEVTEKRRMKQKKKDKLRGETTKQTTLKLCAWTLLVTNASKEQLSSKEAFEMYGIRWQIEICFKQLKSIFQIHKADTAKKDRLLCEIYGKLIAAMITTKIHGKLNSESWAMKHKEVSIEKFFKRIQERAFKFAMLLLNNVRVAVRYINQEILYCLKNCFKLKQQSRKTSLELLISAQRGNFRTMNLVKLTSLS